MYLNLREDITVIRQRWSPPSTSTAGSCSDPFSLSQPLSPSYDFYQAPFANFPIIQSHVHPFCIIYNAGQKLHHKPYITPPSHINQSDLDIVRRLYGQFTAAPPPSWGRDVPIAPREPPSDEEGGSRKRSRNDPFPPTRQRRSFAKTSKVITQTAHTTGEADRGRRCGVQSSKKMRTLDISMTALTPKHDSILLTDSNLAPCRDREDDHSRDLKDWADEVASHAAYGQGDAPLLNDHQIGNYIREQARKPLRYPWHAALLASRLGSHI